MPQRTSYYMPQEWGRARSPTRDRVPRWPALPSPSKSLLRPITGAMEDRDSEFMEDMPMFSDVPPILRQRPGPYATRFARGGESDTPG
ncbi:hypothetical protein V492_04237 [Pseudogymnoascus sp. VKM F-4246]|nr:hypothetical protein V492_04237 [Pseudogymnoascus sp. VKM F-4246]